jgi:hypothetical protein
MFILCKSIQFLNHKVRKGRRSVSHSSDNAPRKGSRSVVDQGGNHVAHSSDDDTSEYEAAWSLQRTAKESECSFCMDQFLPELKNEVPALVDDSDHADVPHMLAGAEADEHDHFGFEYITDDSYISVVCESSKTENNCSLLEGAKSWDFSEDLSEDCFLKSMQPEPPPEEDILETYLRNKQEFMLLLTNHPPPRHPSR